MIEDDSINYTDDLQEIHLDIDDVAHELKKLNATISRIAQALETRR